jgi:predicted Ser/Thr protein kinase
MCRACSREVRDGAALWCSYCGAPLGDNDTAAAHAATISGPLPRGGVPTPDLRLSQYGPLNDARFAPGQIFASRYRIVSLLGRGAMGEVYRAEDLKLGQPVALKLIAVRAARGDDRLLRFIAEVRLAREIAHPNVCRVYDIGEAEGWHYLSMEFVDGETLQSLMRRIGRLPGEKALDMARQLCAGLAAAHDRGVLHRDLKPSNIMVDGRGQIRILDFGLAVPSGEWTIGEIAGTPAYMAPEQVVGDRATERTDVYALGLVLYELYTGRRFFPVETFEERRRVSHDTSIPHSLLGIDQEVERIIRSCLETDSARRPASALAIAALLPGGDPVAAAIAKGVVPSPEMVAAAGPKGTLHPPQAWTLLGAILVGTLATATQAHVVNVAPSDVPKPPEVLAERARNILAGIGADRVQDTAFWFAFDRSRASSSGASPAAQAMAPDGERSKVTFVYRQSPRYLVPHNPFRLVTDVDPPFNLPGMAMVTLDPVGRLVLFTRVPEQATRAPASDPEIDWAALFGEAGLDRREFVAAEPDRSPFVPHDTRFAWIRKPAVSGPFRVTAATLDGKAVQFNAGNNDTDAYTPQPGPLSTRSPIADLTMWTLIISVFAGSAVLARYNLRLGQGDRRGARRLSIFGAGVGLLGWILRAHHVPIAIDEITGLFGATGWALAWGGLTWLTYISLEPYVRRLWPRTLISWTRLLSGRLRDPLVGRDVLIGMLAGIVRAMIVIVAISTGAVNAYSAYSVSALESLSSIPRFINIVLPFQIGSSLVTGLISLFVLLLIRLIVRKTWIAVGLALLVAIPLAAAPFGWELVFVIAAPLVSLTIFLRVGLLAYFSVLLTDLLFRVPMTLDPDAWYFGHSLVVLLLIATLATYGFVVSLGGRPAFGGSAV